MYTTSLKKRWHQGSMRRLIGQRWLVFIGGYRKGISLQTFKFTIQNWHRRENAFYKRHHHDIRSSFPDYLFRPNLFNLINIHLLKKSEPFCWYTYFFYFWWVRIGTSTPMVWSRQREFWIFKEFSAWLTRWDKISKIGQYVNSLFMEMTKHPCVLW